MPESQPPSPSMMRHHAAHALFRGDVGVRAAHVGAHPARVQRHNRHVAVAQIDGQALDHHVQGGLGAAVEVVAAGGVARDAAHQAAETNDPFLLTLGDGIEEGLDHARRPQDVDGEDLRPGGVVDLAQKHLGGSVNAGVVEEQVDGPAAQLVGEGGDVARLGHVQGVDGGAAVGGVGERPQVGRGFGLAAAGQDLRQPAAPYWRANSSPRPRLAPVTRTVGMGTFRVGAASERGNASVPEGRPQRQKQPDGNRAGHRFRGGFGRRRRRGCGPATRQETPPLADGQ